MPILQKDLDRFLKYVNKDGPIHPTCGQCWQWTGSTNRDGYGRLKISRRLWIASRVSWQIHNGPIPDGLYILHKCDNPSCVNPNHLFVGTRADNSADMIAEGRSCGPRGERQGHAKLTEEQVLEIRKLYNRGSKIFGTYGFSKKYGVNQSQIWKIVRRKQWRHTCLS